VYRTSIRATGVGVGNGFSRVGGILCPLFAVEMVGQEHHALHVITTRHPWFSDPLRQVSTEGQIGAKPNKGRQPSSMLEPK